MLDSDGHQLLADGMVLMDLFWIIAGIFASAIAISIILGKLHGTLLI